MPKYIVREGEHHIIHDGEEYNAGDVLTATEAQAKMLRVDPVDAKQAAPNSTDGNVAAAAAAIGAMTDPKDIKAYIKGDDRKGVNDAADARLEALKNQQ